MKMSEVWRASSMVDPKITYLNTGTLGPTLRPAWDSVTRLYETWMQMGPGGSLELQGGDGYFHYMELQDRCRSEMAKWLRVDPSQVAITGNASDGINLVTSSIPFHDGDHVIITNEEHEALSYPIKRLAKRFHLSVTEIEFPVSDTDFAFAERVHDALRPNTRLVALSHVSHRTGWTMPLEDVCDVLANHQAWFLVDGAHAVGTKLLRIPDRVDVYVFPGHKWLFATVGTGVVIGNPRVFDMMVPILGGAPSLVNGVRSQESFAGRCEFGTRNWALTVGICEALRFRSQWSEDEIIQHYGEITKSFRAGYGESGCRITCNGTGPLLNISTTSADRVAEGLWHNERILVKGHAFGLRVSLPPWVDVDEATAIGKVIGEYVTNLGLQMPTEK